MDVMIKEYLKMADFFYGELSANNDEGIGSIIDADGEHVMQSMENSHMASGSNKDRNEQRKIVATVACHAINSHDELVKKLQTAESTLDEVERVLAEAQKNGNYDFDDLLAEVVYAIKRIGEDD